MNDSISRHNLMINGHWLQRFFSPKISLKEKERKDGIAVKLFKGKK
jgi:hypothetical protein